MGALSLSSSAADVMWRMVVFGVGYGLFRHQTTARHGQRLCKPAWCPACPCNNEIHGHGLVWPLGAVFLNPPPYYLRMLSATGSLLENQAFMLAVRDAYLAAAFIDVLCMLASSVRGKQRMPKSAT